MSYLSIVREHMSQGREVSEEGKAVQFMTWAPSVVKRRPDTKGAGKKQEAREKVTRTIADHPRRTRRRTR